MVNKTAETIRTIFRMQKGLEMHVYALLDFISERAEKGYKDPTGKEEFTNLIDSEMGKAKDRLSDLEGYGLPKDDLEALKAKYETTRKKLDNILDRY